MANGGLGGPAILTTARQYGIVRLTVQVLDEEPALDPSRDAAVELSLHTGESMPVTGWAGEWIIAVPLPSAVDVRVRYASPAGGGVELAGVPDPDRRVAVIDRALAAHPDVARRLRAGDDRYRVGVIRYLQELFRVTHSAGTCDDIRHDHERLDHLIDERAQLRDP